MLDPGVGGAHRMGQKHTVNVVNLIVKGAVEERLWGLGMQRKSLPHRRSGRLLGRRSPVPRAAGCERSRIHCGGASGGSGGCDAAPPRTIRYTRAPSSSWTGSSTPVVSKRTRSLP